MSRRKLEWNVYNYNINGRKMEVFNIFNHYSFARDVDTFYKKCKTKEEFAEEVKSSLMYFFWCKCEYEILLSAWCGGNGKEALKIDVYQQVMLNWDSFIDYLWGKA